jgi:hypothetical protein
MESKDKFIGFVDILGFKDLVRRAEAGQGMSFAEINDAVVDLGSEEDREAIRRYGPTICPMSSRQSDDLDFQITQVADCVIVSTEVSPAGAITLINHCWIAVFKLLRRGLMCRGHIRRGNILHEGQRFMGTGYQQAIEREKDVMAFKRYEDERGTPFVEVDSSVINYIHDFGDECVRKILPRFVEESTDVCALFPFNRLTDTFDIGSNFDVDAKKKEVQLIRSSIEQLKSRLHLYVDKENPNALRKLEHYEAGLNEQLRKCEQLVEMIDHLGAPFPSHRL